MPYGYAGKILCVDLSRGSIEVEEPEPRLYRTYMGGSALAMYYILREMPEGVEPLSPANVLVFAIGPVTGVPISGQSRVMCNAKSPLTGVIGDSQAGGFWPAELKFAGFDAIVIRGRAAQPVYLWIHDGHAELCDGVALWGKTTGEVEALIRQELGDERIKVAQIGPAGEKLVRFSAIMNMCSRANGRTGMGAVMGSKNLKAIAVRGHGKPKVFDRGTVLRLAKWGVENLAKNSEIYNLSMYGTPSVVAYQQETGGLPTRNFTSGVLAGFENITGEAMADTILRRRDTCFACAVRCKRVVEVEEPFSVDPAYGGPEYETLAAFGSYCEIDNLAAIAKANQICNKYGLDTISCGATIAFAMECFERGIITTEDTRGIELRFGNSEAMLKVLELIVDRHGIGDLLAEGSVRAARELGKEAEACVVAVKGSEVPAHMPQVKRSLALIYAVQPFGADHQSHAHDPSYGPEASSLEQDRLAQLGLFNPQAAIELTAEKVRYALYTQYFYSVLDTLGLCQFVWGPTWQLYGPNQLVELVKAVTGWDTNLWEIMKVGERRLNLLRAFNAREGVTRQNDMLPRRLFDPLSGGPTDGICLEQQELEKALDQYYAMAGFDVASGTPTRAKLEELGLAWVADQIGL